MEKSSTALIKAKNLSFNYDGANGETVYPALKGINLRIEHQEHVAIIGANGSGKTTLLKLLNALILPFAGEVLIGGISTASSDQVPAIRQMCGMIFQNPDNQLVATTVEEDIAFGLENQNIPSAAIRQRVTEVAQRLGLTPLLKKPPHLLSGGEKQRVAIAGILAMRPRCILMDEPTAMLDPSGRREVLKTVTDLNKNEGVALVHVTHFAEEAALADRVLVMDSGHVVKEGPPEAVLTDFKLLHALGLQGTMAAELAALLREDGFKIPTETLNSQELVKGLCLYRQKN